MFRIHKDKGALFCVCHERDAITQFALGAKITARLPRFCNSACDSVCNKRCTYNQCIYTFKHFMDYLIGFFSVQLPQQRQSFICLVSAAPVYSTCCPINGGWKPASSSGGSVTEGTTNATVQQGEGMFSFLAVRPLICTANVVREQGKFV